MSRNSRQKRPLPVMKKSIHIEPTLLKVLREQSRTPFTAAELTTAYRAKCDEHGRNERASRQFVSRNMTRLVKNGVVRYTEAPSGSKALYEFTGFTEAKTPERPARHEVIRILRERLHQHRVELLTAMGETEEYDALCACTPELRTTVQAHYNEARDRTSKLVGRVRALESLIADQSESYA